MDGRDINSSDDFLLQNSKIFHLETKTVKQFQKYAQDFFEGLN
jgi:hypothetical protein